MSSGGIYVHIPFCYKKCNYCDFYKETNLDIKESFLCALLKEIELKAEIIKQINPRTIYFGGGTPSVLSSIEINRVLDALFSIVDPILIDEITLEVNPDDIDALYVESLKLTRINRISIGVQSIFNRMLKIMGRRHNFEQVEFAISLFNSNGYNNLSVDLIYGLPGLTLAEWKQSIDIVLSWPVKHISTYHLTIEKGTVFNSWLKQGKIAEVDDIESHLQYQMLVENLKIEGFDRYEISNFSKPGFESMHNSIYWKGEPYVGLGPSAHSFYDGKRFWNISNTEKYISCLSNEKTYFDFEVLSEADSYNEFIMLGLRTKQGVDIDLVKSRFTFFYEYFISRIKPFVDSEMMVIEDNHFLRVTEKGIYTVDFIIRELFYND